MIQKLFFTNDTQLITKVRWRTGEALEQEGWQGTGETFRHTTGLRLRLRGRVREKFILKSDRVFLAFWISIMAAKD
jgi:hypothetical protein